MLDYSYKENISVVSSLFDMLEHRDDWLTKDMSSYMGKQGPQLNYVPLK